MKQIFLALILLIGIDLHAQEPTLVEIINANTLEYNKDLGENVRRLLGNVVFKHDSSYMYCDSAYSYPDSNSLDAFSNVYIKQGDSLHIYGDFLRYHGNTRIAEMHNNVKLIDNNLTLKTNHLRYNLKTDIGDYYEGGKILDDKNILTSDLGYYYAKRKEFFFKNNVFLDNPECKMYSDTLKYNTQTEISYFFGPTNIYGDSNRIYCENGWYDTKKEDSQYNKNARLYNKSQILNGDSLYYDRNKGFGKALENVTIIDTVENLIVKGNIAEYDEIKEKTMVTDSAMMIMVSEGDSLFLHSDTLRANYDSTGLHKIVKAYNHVKIFKQDLQGKCDSLVYTFQDSTARLFVEPVMWSEKNQMSAEYVEIHKSNDKIESIDMYNSAFIISQEDSIRFNQIKGRKITAYLKDNELDKIYVEGNGETIYFGREEDSTYIGVNKAIATNLWIYIVDNEVNKITYIDKPTATFYPIDELPKQELILKGFKWEIKKRPLKRDDIFYWVE